MWGWGRPLESNKSAGVVERSGFGSDSGCGAVRDDPFLFWSLRDIRFIPGCTAVAPDYCQLHIDFFLALLCVMPRVTHKSVVEQLNILIFGGITLDISSSTLKSIQ
jgi:hypothetical protein